MKEDTALFADSLPCNHVPFVRALHEHLSGGGKITDSKSRRLLWVSLQIQYGQCAKLDLASLDRDGAPTRDCPATQLTQGWLDDNGALYHGEAVQTGRIARLAVMSYGATGVVDLSKEWEKLDEEWKQSQLAVQHKSSHKPVVAGVDLAKGKDKTATAEVKLHEDGKISVQPFTVKPDDGTLPD